MSNGYFIVLAILICIFSIGVGIFISERNRRRKKNKENENDLKSLTQMIANGEVTVATEDEVMAGTFNDEPITPLSLNKLMREFEQARVDSINKRSDDNKF